MEGYRILDEPRPGLHARLSVNPFWPFLAVMLGGVWLGWPWFLFNSFALGSATRAREVVAVVAGLAGSLALILLGAMLVMRDVLSPTQAAYAVTALVAWKVAVSYYLHIQQSRSFELYEYFGGESKNGMLVVIAGFLARGSVESALGSALFRLMLT